MEVGMQITQYMENLNIKLREDAENQHKRMSACRNSNNPTS
jgi:hypothetical protein